MAMKKILQYDNVKIKKKLEDILPEKISDTQVDKADMYTFVSSVMIAVVNILFIRLVIKLLVTKKLRWK